VTPSIAQPDLERVYAKLLLIRRAEEEVARIIPPTRSRVRSTSRSRALSAIHRWRVTVKI
jgi:hypothetical protein